MNVLLILLVIFLCGQIFFMIYIRKFMQKIVAEFDLQLKKVVAFEKQFIEIKEMLNDKIMQLNSFYETRFRTFSIENRDELQKIENVVENKIDDIRNLVNEKLQKNLDYNMNKFSMSVSEQLKNNKEGFDAQFEKLYLFVREEFKKFSGDSSKELKEIRQTVENRLNEIRDNNNKKLDEMKNIVDGKLQETLEKRVSQAFNSVSTQLSQVHEELGKQLGEMKILETNVGNLDKVLSNVKTRGILGEIQLGAILEQILSPQQYEMNIKTKKDSENRVEYAVKMPIKDGGYIYLPIDSKFPLDTYNALREAYETSDKNAIEEAKKIFVQRIKSFAKDIKTKYIAPPDTTDFAIMFLPFEGLYCEVVNCRGLLEELHRTYRVNVAGPSTMSALLNTLQLSFQAFAIQKRSSEVWKVLGAVKTEFNKFGEVLEKTQKKLEQANIDLDTLIGTRTRQIRNKLKNVEVLNLELAEKILPIDMEQED